MTEAPDVASAGDTGTKRCPFCAEVIQAAAIKCKHCRERLPVAAATAPEASSSTAAASSVSVSPDLGPRFSAARSLASLVAGVPFLFLLLGAGFVAGGYWIGRACDGSCASEKALVIAPFLAVFTHVPFAIVVGLRQIARSGRTLLVVAVLQASTIALIAWFMFLMVFDFNILVAPLAWNYILLSSAAANAAAFGVLALQRRIT